MLSTVNSVKEYTGQDVTLDLIKRAQAIVEIFIGRDEIDVQSPSDLLLLDKMTAYQSAYMMDNEELIYKQIAALSVGSGDSSQNYNTTMSAPFMAPLAVIAARGLTFKRSRSVNTGKIFQWPTYLDWRKI
jgi:hypothetical protein